MKYLLLLSVVFIQGCAVFTKSNRADNYIGKEVFRNNKPAGSGQKVEVLKYDLDKMSHARVCEKYTIKDILDNTIRGQSVVILEGKEGSAYVFMDKSEDPSLYFSSQDECAIQAKKIAEEKQNVETERVSKIKSFISKNKQFKKYEKVALDRKIQIGMPEGLLLLSWGEPEDMNESVYSFGVHRQYVYGNQYVYTENGIITSWQKM